jgi:putative flippase GtrA
VLNAYYWSDRFVFKKGEGEARSAIWTLAKTYVAYGSTGLLLASILLYLYVDKLHISEYIAQLLVLVITIPLNFIINKFWSFKTKQVNEED